MTEFTEETRKKWWEESEDDARNLMAIRDTLAIIDPLDFPVYSKARREARAAEALKEGIEARFDRQLSCCPKCEEAVIQVAYSERWTVKCAFCGWTAQGDTWAAAQDDWNGGESR